MKEVLRPTRVEIDLKALDNNIKVIRSIIGNRKIMSVVKANAYGHGLLPIAKHLVKNDIDYLAVAFIEEAIQLRKEGIKIPILVLGAINNEQIEMFLKNDISLTGSSEEKLESISSEAERLNITAKVHLKVDTGMGRIGVQWDRIDPFLKKAFSLPSLKIEGVFSHFANSPTDKEFTNTQIERFNIVLEKVSKYIDRNNILIHLSNSGAIDNKIEDAFFDMIRTGLMMYGYSTNTEVQKKLQPVMNFKTKISYFKVLNKGLTVGYNRTYTTKEMTRIATLPVGYADGYPRSLSNKGNVFINNKKYPVIGNVCMDQTMVNLGNDGEAYNGDDVLLWGKDKSSYINLWDVSKLSNRSIYEILCSISQRVPRVYID